MLTGLEKPNSPPPSQELSRELRVLWLDENAGPGSLLKSPAGIRFRDCIQEWLESDHRHVPKLKELTDLLTAASGKLSIGLLDWIAEWVRRQLSRPFKKRALKALVEMRAELLKPVPPS